MQVTTGMAAHSTMRRMTIPRTSQGAARVDPGAARGESKNPIQVIERMMKLLEVLAQHPEPLGLKQIAQYTGLHPSTAHRILSSMSADRMVDRVEPGSYRLGMRLLELGNLVKSRISVRELALPLMRELHAATGETANLSVRHDDEIVYVERTSSGRSAMRVVHVIGARAPLHVTAAGKLFLLEDGFARLRDYARRTGLNALTPNTLTSLPQIERELERIQRTGWATDAEEAELGVRCVAAGIRDDAGRLIAALSLSTPADRMKPQWGMLVKQTADRISQAVGHLPSGARIGVA
jgi:DNA-binding IclR family transcriptional regulator